MTLAPLVVGLNVAGEGTMLPVQGQSSSIPFPLLLQVPSGVMEVFGEEMENVQRALYFGLLDSNIDDVLAHYIGTSPKRFNTEVGEGSQVEFLDIVSLS